VAPVRVPRIVQFPSWTDTWLGGDIGEMDTYAISQRLIPIDLSPRSSGHCGCRTGLIEPSLRDYHGDESLDQ
jgi:hypothetical protein